VEIRKELLQCLSQGPGDGTTIMFARLETSWSSFDACQKHLLFFVILDLKFSNDCWQYRDYCDRTQQTTTTTTTTTGWYMVVPTLYQFCVAGQDLPYLKYDARKNLFYHATQLLQSISLGQDRVHERLMASAGGGSAGAVASTTTTATTSATTNMNAPKMPSTRMQQMMRTSKTIKNNDNGSLRFRRYIVISKRSSPFFSLSHDEPWSDSCSFSLFHANGIQS
jgi:hypothetical protein